jgi:hypothetical protein
LSDGRARPPGRPQPFHPWPIEIGLSISKEWSGHFPRSTIVSSVALSKAVDLAPGVKTRHGRSDQFSQLAID